MAIAAVAILLAERFFRRGQFGVALCWLGLLGAAATWALAK